MPRKKMTTPATFHSKGTGGVALYHTVENNLLEQIGIFSTREQANARVMELIGQGYKLTDILFGEPLRPVSLAVQWDAGYAARKMPIATGKGVGSKGVGRKASTQANVGGEQVFPKTGRQARANATGQSLQH